MKTIVRWTGCLVGVLSQFAATADAQSRTWLFVNHDTKWEAGPPGLGYETAVGSVTLFRDDGTLIRVSCQLYRDSGKPPLSIDLKAGYAVSVGRWNLVEKSKMEVKLHLVAADKLATPPDKPLTIPGPEKSE